MYKAKVYFENSNREVSNWFPTTSFIPPTDNSEEWSKNHSDGFPHICRVSGWMGIIRATAYYSFSDEEMEACNGDTGMLNWDYGLDRITLDLDAFVEKLKGEGFVEFRPGFYIKENEDLEYGEGYIVSSSTGRNRYYSNIEDAMLDEHGEDIEEEEE